MSNWIKEHGVYSGIAGAILTVIVAIIIDLIANKNEDKQGQGISIGGDLVVSGVSANWKWEHRILKRNLKHFSQNRSHSKTSKQFTITRSCYQLSNSKSKRHILC